MKLTTRSSATSFYESFSDLIFGVLAIFVLISMVFLVLIRHGGGGEDTTELKAALAAAQEEARRARTQAAAMVSATFEQKKQLESEQAANRAMAEAIKTRGLELVIAVDRTSSMSLGLKDLVEAVSVFAGVLPQFSSDFRVGVLAYHAEPTKFEVYRLTPVLPKEKDGGRSLADLDLFLRRLTPQTGFAPVSDAMAKGFAMFSDSRSFGGAQVFMLLGDAGPFEVNPGNQSAAELSAHAVGLARQWVGTNERRKVVSVYAKTSCMTLQAQQKAECTLPEESEKFFRELCMLTNDAQDCESLGSEKMLVYLMRAIRG